MRPHSASVFLVGILTGCAPSDGPHVDAIEPAEAARGTPVTLRGEGFCGVHALADDGSCAELPSGAVSFGIDPQVSSVVTSWRDDRIEAVVPQAAASGEVLVVVTVDGRSSNGVSFRVR